MKKANASLLLLLGCFASFAQQSASRKPNIIYIYADDLGYGELGSYGQTKIKTPSLDQLAREGIRFTQHYSGAPVCAPSRCMLLTGKHAGHSYIRGNYELGGFEDEKEGGQMPLPEGTFTIAHLLKKAGYTTAAIGKWGLGMANTTGDPNKQGFDYFYGYLDQKQAHNFYPTHLWENGKWDRLNNPFIYVHRPLDSAKVTDKDFDSFIGEDYAPARMTQKALDFLERNRQKPFFLYLPYTLPHLSLQAPPQGVMQYAGKFDERTYYGQRGYAATKYPLSTYAAMITYLDAQVGLILEKIKSLGLDENTIVMFSSDNGATFDVGGTNTAFFNSTGGLRGRKQDLYEGGIRMPFLARWPGKIKPGKITNHVSVQYDLMATIADLTGTEVPVTDGISFLPVLMGEIKQQLQHTFLYFEYPENGGQIAIRIDNWKGVKTDLRKNPDARWKLYDLRVDEKETTDIADQHPDILKKMDAILKKQHQPAHIREWEFLDPKFTLKEK